MLLQYIQSTAQRNYNKVKTSFPAEKLSTNEPKAKTFPFPHFLGNQTHRNENPSSERGVVNLRERFGDAREMLSSVGSGEVVLDVRIPPESRLEAVSLVEVLHRRTTELPIGDGEEEEVAARKSLAFLIQRRVFAERESSTLLGSVGPSPFTTFLSAQFKPKE